MGFFSNKAAATDQNQKEAYFTASQGQLIRARYKTNRTAMVAGWVLTLMILTGFFSEFLSPYAPTMAGRDKQYENGPPQIPKFWDENGFSFSPFIYGTKRERSIKTNFRWVISIDRQDRRYMHFFVEGWEYSYINIDWNFPGEAFDLDVKALTFNTHLFGVDKGGVHLFGTDKSGKDIYSRTLRAIFTSLKCGALGVFIAFVLALVIGGISGYYGGWIDQVLQMITDAMRTVPPLPLFMALAAFLPQEWSAEAVFFVISSLLGLIGWPTLARRIRTHLLSERSQEYVLAAELCGASSSHIIRRHLLPSFTSYIIVDLMITFPYMVRLETALSFIGLGLIDPVSSLGSLMQNVSKVDVLLNYQWYFIPVIFFIAFVLAFVFVGDGLRDASDPYSHVKK
ncbi:MAG: ABC transporter permease [SAR324 cluster bacterium]|jgi:peptide/nickel transport system permease protein|nr:ABC transporter permease [SAR324 cluster bacterium]|tara:strand:+ start:2551 stop:3741 length:1191 start_codon:yes stop_codon:yes gene_type:complete